MFLFNRNSFGHTDLQIRVCDTDCDGNEDKLIECYLDTSCGYSGCTHNDDIGISCSKLATYVNTIL